ncbi:cell-surface adhesin [Acinetobacter baumannii]|nr:cell-surface adhesin [Acinetobacter baumannii]
MVEFDKPADGTDVEVTATVTDKAGNKSPEGSDDSTIGDTTAPKAPSVVINDGGDGVINPTDLVNGKVTATVKPTEPVEEGDKVTITLPNGSTQEVVVDGSNKDDINTNGIVVEFDKPADGTDVELTATVTDKAGNKSPEGKDNSTVDLVVGSLEITEINEDGVVKGQTTDVPVGSDVVLTFKDHTGSQINDPVTGKPVTVTTVVKPDGSYEAQLPEDLTSLTDQINVKADSFDNNGKPVSDNEDTKKPITEVTTNGNDSLIGTTGDDVLAGDTGGLKTNFVASQNYNVSIVLDLSGSMGYPLNYDDPTSRLDIVKSGLKLFIQKMVEHDGLINLQFSTFSGDLGSEKIFGIINSSNIDAVLNYIDGLQPDSNTQPNLGFNKTDGWFSSISNEYENQTYYLTDGDPSVSLADIDLAFAPVAEKSKVFAIGISNDVLLSNVERYDNTDIYGNKKSGTWDGDTNHGTAQRFTQSDELIAYFIGGSENFVPADVGNDVVKGGAGDDILFGDAMNTNWITGLDPLQYPKYSGYSKLIAHLKAEVTDGAEPTQQQIYDFVKANYKKFVDADATDAETKGGNDTIYGGSGNDIIIAGAGDDRIYGGSGDDIISTGRGNDTIVYDVLDAADAMGGNGTDTWIDYETNDKIEFGADFFEGLLADKSNISEYIKVEDVNGKAVLKVDRDGAADASGGTTHDWADLLIIEGKTASELQDLINNQIIIG